MYFARATRYFGLRGVSGTYLTGGHGSNSTWLTSWRVTVGQAWNLCDEALGVVGGL